MTSELIDARVADVPAREDSYRELFSNQFPGLVRLAALLGADDPEDTAQEAFVRLHRRRSLLRDQNAAQAYLRRTVVNLANSHLRHLRVVRRHAPSLSAGLADVDSAENTAVLNDAQRRLANALVRLPERQRKVVVLRYWLDLPLVEIANLLQMRTGTVKSTLHRAQQTLRTNLEDGS
jgi:RNA polymerase sigma factor (sigma-70 family)